MTLKEIIKDPTTKFVDVRTNAEFRTGHIDGAVNIPLDQVQYRYREIGGLDKTPVVLYCRTGNRSGEAVAYLRRKGFSNVHNGGGLEDVRFYLN